MRILFLCCLGPLIYMISSFLKVTYADVVICVTAGMIFQMISDTLKR